MWRAVAVGLTGAILAVAAFALLYNRTAAMVFELDRDLGEIASGLSPVERVGQDTFAWTAREARITLADADRRVAWRCAVRFRGARPDSIPQPLIALAIDGVTLRTVAATNAYEELEVVAPPRERRSGLTFSITSTPTFQPGPSDRRELGVQLDRLSCAPDGSRRVWPPSASLIAVAVSAASFGVVSALAGLSLPLAMGAAVAIGIGLAVPLSHGAAPYAPDYLARVAWLAFGIALTCLLTTGGLRRWGRQQLTPEAIVVVLLSGAAAYLKLIALFHPAKRIIDEVFHAHRLDWILDGRFYFTQPMPDGVSFPYAIALYVFASPWTLLTSDHVALLRIVVTGAEAVAGALLYWIVVRLWRDRLAGVFAVALFHVVPLPFVIIGNANLTNAFGQSASLVAIAAAAVWSLPRPGWRQIVALTLLATVAYLSHVSTISMLMSTLLAMAVLYRWRGGAPLRGPARGVLLAACAAAVLSAALYYAHFPAVYQALGRVRGNVAVTDTIAARPASTPVTLPSRAAATIGITARNIGWPILVLAAIGVFGLRRVGSGDRLVLVLLACATTYVAFAAVGTLLPVGARFERYIVEFIGRVDFATYPAVVIAAAYGAALMWRASAYFRAGAVALMAFAAASGIDLWLSWSAG